MNKIKIVKNFLPILWGVIFLFLFFIFFVKPLGWDSTFPLDSASLKWTRDNLVYMWNGWLLGSTNVIEKLRGIGPFLFSLWNLYSIKTYVGLFAFLWYMWFFLLLRDFSPANSVTRSLLALLFVINPLTLSHLWHTFIIQGYMLLPYMVWLFIKYMNSNKLLNRYLLFFIIILLFLWQPHNYLNNGLIMFLIVFVFVVQKYQKENIIKLVVLWCASIIILSPVIISFILTTPNELTASTQSFDWTEPNMIRSSDQSFLNTLVYKINYFWDSSTIAAWYIYLMSLLLIFWLYCFIWSRFWPEKYKKIYLWILALFISLSFIATNYIFQLEELRQFIYKILPHIRVDIAYMMLLVTPMTIILFAFISEKLQNYRIYLLNTILVSLILIVVLLYSEQSQYDNIIDKNKYDYFKERMAISIWERLEPKSLLLQPLSVTYQIPWIPFHVYPWIFLDSFQNISAYHRNFKELGLVISKKFVWEYINRPEFLENTYFTHILCFKDKNTLCDTDSYKPLYVKHGQFWSWIILYQAKINPELVYSANTQLIYKYHNPWQVSVNIESISGSKIHLWLKQTYHPWWSIISDSEETSTLKLIFNIIFNNKIISWHHSIWKLYDNQWILDTNKTWKYMIIFLPQIYYWFSCILAWTALLLLTLCIIYLDLKNLFYNK